MRVLFISSFYPPYYIGGYELACSEVARGLVSRGHEVLVITSFSHVPAPPESEYIKRCLELRSFDPYPVSGRLHDYELFEASCSNLKNSFEVITALRRFDPDIVYCWHLHGIGGLAIVDLLTMLGVPCIFHLMDNIPSLLINVTPKKVREIFTRADHEIFTDARVIAISEHLLSEIRESTGITFRRQVEIIPGWVSLQGCRLRSNYHNEDRTTFMMAGAIVEHKGIDLILQAAAHTVQQGRANFRIDFYGSGRTDHYLAMAVALGLRSHVRFLGPRDKLELIQEYPNYDAFLFPTWEREPFGIAPIEAAACGCVPIVTSRCGVAERLVGDVHCLKIERTVPALSEVMRAVISKEVDLARIGQAAAALVRSDLTFERCLDRIEKVLEAAICDWERLMLNDSKLLLLIHTKHHLARYISFHVDNASRA